MLREMTRPTLLMSPAGNVAEKQLITSDEKYRGPKVSFHELIGMQSWQSILAHWSVFLIPVAGQQKNILNFSMKTDFPAHQHQTTMFPAKKKQNKAGLIRFPFPPLKTFDF